MVLNRGLKVEPMDMLLGRGVPGRLEFMLRVCRVGGCRQEVRVLGKATPTFAEAQNVS